MNLPKIALVIAAIAGTAAWAAPEQAEWLAPGGFHLAIPAGFKAKFENQRTVLSLEYSGDSDSTSGIICQCSDSDSGRDLMLKEALSQGDAAHVIAKPATAPMTQKNVSVQEWKGSGQADGGAPVEIDIVLMQHGKNAILLTEFGFGKQTESARAALLAVRASLGFREADQEHAPSLWQLWTAPSGISVRVPAFFECMRGLTSFEFSNTALGVSGSFESVSGSENLDRKIQRCKEVLATGNFKMNDGSTTVRQNGLDVTYHLAKKPASEESAALVVVRLGDNALVGVEYSPHLEFSKEPERWLAELNHSFASHGGR